MSDLIIATLAQGLLWSLLAIGVFITFRVLDIADLTVEGSFPLGAAISATLIVDGVNPIVSIVVAAIGGMLAGAITGWIHTKLKIPALLAGILTMICNTDKCSRYVYTVSKRSNDTFALPSRCC